MTDSIMTVIDMEDDMTPTQQEWTKESMLALLRPEEMWGDKPRAVGLRRISQIILGPIVKTEVTIPKCELNHAVVVYSVTYATPRGLVTSTDAAESSDYNTSEFFMAFPVASTTTKASGRAFKSAIGLDVMTAEEMAARIEQARASLPANWTLNEETLRPTPPPRPTTGGPWRFDGATNDWVIATEPPFPSWTLSEDGLRYVAPTPRPEGQYRWDEATLSWVAFNV